MLRTRLPPLELGQQEAFARFEHVESCDSEAGRDAIAAFWLKAVESRCEGLMIKVRAYGMLCASGPTCLLSSCSTMRHCFTDPGDGNHFPRRTNQVPSSLHRRGKSSLKHELIDKRTSAWLKLKKDYVRGLGDSLDLVPIGAWHGNGRKAQWWSPILLAIYDPGLGKPVAVCKCMSGE
jgi:DNA ligase-1